MKQVLYTVLIAALLIGAFAGCAGKPPADRTAAATTPAESTSLPATAAGFPAPSPIASGAGEIVNIYNLSDLVGVNTTVGGGGQQNRIVRLGNDLYFAFPYEGGEYHDYVLLRYNAAAGEWTQIFKGKSKEWTWLQACEANGCIYLYAYNLARGITIVEYNPVTDTIDVNETRVFFPQEAQQDLFSYTAACISGRYLYLMSCGLCHDSYGYRGAALSRYINTMC